MEFDVVESPYMHIFVISVKFCSIWMVTRHTLSMFEKHDTSTFHVTRSTFHVVWNTLLG
jgi:hypothetical protein